MKKKQQVSIFVLFLVLEAGIHSVTHSGNNQNNLLASTSEMLDYMSTPRHLSTVDIFKKSNSMLSYKKLILPVKMHIERKWKDGEWCFKQMKIKLGKSINADRFSKSENCVMKK